MDILGFKRIIDYPHELKAIKAIVKKHNGTISLWDREEKEYMIRAFNMPIEFKIMDDIKTYYKDK